jgi:hypothetical protein
MKVVVVVAAAAVMVMMDDVRLEICAVLTLSY